MSDNVPSNRFIFDATNPREFQYELWQGETINLSAVIRQDGVRFQIPDGADAFIALEMSDGLREVAGTIAESPSGSRSVIVVTLTKEYTHGQFMLGWFAWRVGGEMSNRYPVRFTIRHTPYPLSPPPNPLPPAVQQWVGVVGKDTLTPTAVEERIAKIEGSAGAAASLQGIKQACAYALAMPSGTDRERNARFDELIQRIFNAIQE